ncbi:MAG: HD domain-containing protein [Oscillospiraceae bacterium]|nr:HD domain-containing protein [Oscillospiraceae bacterium]
MREEKFRTFLEVGVSLSAERDFNRLLEKILSCVMELSNCDAGTLYLLEDGALHFKIMRNNTMNTYSGGDGSDCGLPPVALNRESVCALSLLDDKLLRIEDVWHCEEYDLTGPMRYDAITGYHTQSMIVVPMRNREGGKIGVLQLINAQDEEGRVIPFEEEIVLAVESVASQAAITVQNVRYISQIKNLFHSFVKVMSSAVDERTPYNGSHTRHMAQYGSRFLDFLNERASAAGEEVLFTPPHKEEVLMSVWFHDIGKLVTPLEVMNKMARLLPGQYDAFVHRMEVIRLRSEIERLSGQITQEEAGQTVRDVQDAQALVDAINSCGFVTDERLAELDALAKRTFTDSDGTVKPWLTAEECAMLSIRKGTLSDEERSIMESHVVITDKLLSQIEFSEDYSHVRQWAGSHHELLNGSGYPRHLAGDEIPVEVRIITILDIFDALVADDRPYKPGMPIEKALGILSIMAEKEGKLDPELTRLFIESRCWETQP